MKQPLVKLWCANCRAETYHRVLACIHCNCMHPICFKGDTDKLLRKQKGKA